MARLAIVIPSWNRADLLAPCLQSVVEHAPKDTEIVVVDDASPRGVISRTAERFPGVKVLRMAKRSGFCRAANAGIAATPAKIVELPNDDTLVMPGWAEVALRLFESDPTIGAVAPLVLQLRSGMKGLPKIDSAGDEYDPGGFARKRLHSQTWHGEIASPTDVWGVSATAGFYRRAALDQVGTFPDDFGAYFEDVDLSHRLRHGGWQIIHTPESQVWHRVSASYGRKPGRRVLTMQSCNEERVFWRNHRGSSRRLLRHGLVLAAKSCRRIEEGTFLPWVTGRLAAWGRLVQRAY